MSVVRRGEFLTNWNEQEPIVEGWDNRQRHDDDPICTVVVSMALIAPRVERAEMGPRDGQLN